MYKQKQNTTFHRQQTIYTLINIIMIIMKHKLLVHLKNYPSCQIPGRHIRIRIRMIQNNFSFQE